MEKQFNNIPYIMKDDFSNSTIIKWISVSCRSIFDGFVMMTADDFRLKFDFDFSFNYVDNSDHIVFKFNSKHIKPKQFDKVLFLFENGELFQFELTGKPILTSKGALEFKTQITKHELELFAQTNLKKWKIILEADNREIIGGERGRDENYPDKERLQIVIKKFANDYINLVKETIPNYMPLELRTSETQAQVLSEESCFVYLMYNTTNDFYKIGISNNPSYRERTLQSEKPTIELIIAKEYPIRKIAESIEQSLHKVYDNKRLRGEWFELEEEDVNNIIKTLS